MYLRAETHAAPVAGSATAVALVQESSYLVLVAADDPGFRRALSDELRAAGYIVLASGDGRELSAYLRDVTCCDTTDEAPDVVVADLDSLDAAVLDVLEDAREGWAAPAVICVTQSVDVRAMQEARRLDAMSIVPKTSELDQLVALCELATMAAP